MAMDAICMDTTIIRILVWFYQDLVVKQIGQYVDANELDHSMFGICRQTNGFEDLLFKKLCIN